ncbi:MAG: MBL fold metallo-hydrolase [Archaeoglobaceae archaeon]|nr:MBL fold metallo-hydrolase [Archaeoglobaceae archaeon]
MLRRIVAPPLAANCYLILDEKNVLIDVGGDAEFIMKALKKYVDPKKLDYVILTHSHYDHAAAAGFFKGVAKIAMHKLEYALLKAQGFVSIFGVSFRHFDPDVELVGGEVFDFGETELKVIHTPGHSPGSICLYEPKKKWLFSGDTVFAYGSFGRVDFPGGSAIDLIRSLEILAKLDVENLYPGHEEVVEGDAREHIMRSLKIAKMFL